METVQDPAASLLTGDRLRTDIKELDAALGTAEFQRDPYRMLSQIREVAPVYRSDILDGWLISRFKDVEAVLRDTDRFSAKMFGQMVKRTERTAALVDLIESGMINNLDPPEHTKLRRILTIGIFNPKHLASLRATAAELVGAIMDRIEAGDGTMDLVADITNPLAFGFLARFLGVPAEDAMRFLEWSRGVADLIMQPHADEAAVGRGIAAFEAIHAYVEEQIAQRIATGSTDDVLGLLTAAKDREGLSSEEITATAIQLVFAGGGTSSKGLANTTYLLLRNRDQLEMLRANPALIQPAIHEGLRCESPVFFTYRIAKVDTTIQGVTIPAGDAVVLSLGGANRDPANFKDPERFDISRPRSAHLAFGFGAHLCLGERLARLQAETALLEMLRRFPNLRLTGEEPVWGDRLAIRELNRLSISW